MPKTTNKNSELAWIRKDGPIQCACAVLSRTDWEVRHMPQCCGIYRSVLPITQPLGEKNR